MSLTLVWGYNCILKMRCQSNVTLLRNTCDEPGFDVYHINFNKITFKYYFELSISNILPCEKRFLANYVLLKILILQKVAECLRSRLLFIFLLHVHTYCNL